MKIAIIGSRTVNIDDLGAHLSNECTEIVSGGARGVDNCAERYANENGIKLVEILPEYDKYGKAAPIVRNKQIVDYSDKVIAFWDGKSRGTLSVINYCKKIKKECCVVLIQSNQN